MTARSRAGGAVVVTALLALSGRGIAAEAPSSDAGLQASAPQTGAATVDDPNGVHRLVEQLRVKGTRTAARDALASTGRDAVDDLLPHLTDSDMTVRWEVATILGTIGDRDAAPALVQRVIKDDNPHVRWRSLWSLSRFAEARDATVEEIRGFLDSEDEDDRWNAAVALSMFGEPDGVPMFHAGALHLKPWRRWEAINALGRVHDRATVQVLARVLASNRARERQEAVLSLGKIGGDDAVQLLVAALQDPSEDVRWRACLALGRIADPVAAAPLTALIEAGDEARVVKHARDALARLEDGA